MLTPAVAHMSISRLTYLMWFTFHAQPIKWRQKFFFPSSLSRCACSDIPGSCPVGVDGLMLSKEKKILYEGFILARNFLFNKIQEPFTQPTKRCLAKSDLLLDVSTLYVLLFVTLCFSFASLLLTGSTEILFHCYKANNCPIPICQESNYRRCCSIRVDCICCALCRFPNCRCHDCC